MGSTRSSASGSGSNSGSALVAAGTTQKAPQGFFHCSKCKQTLEIALMCNTRSGVCKADSASYKSLTSKWGKQRALKAWWDGASFN